MPRLCALVDSRMGGEQACVYRHISAPDAHGVPPVAVALFSARTYLTIARFGCRCRPAIRAPLTRGDSRLTILALRTNIVAPDVPVGSEVSESNRWLVAC